MLELVDGPSLAEVLAAGPLEPCYAMDVLAQAAAGLAAAHAAGLVHRDVKPANLLVGPDNQVKITDFGIAYAAGSAPITRTGMLVGTPAYLAPERAAGGPATPASDLYSLGVVGYHCLTGQPPFSGMPVEVAISHQHRALPPLPAAVPAGVAGLIGELTAKDPAARPASASEVARRAGRLRDALGGNTTAVLASEPGGPPSGGTQAMPATLTGPPAPGGAPAGPGSQRDRRRPRRGVLLGMAGAILVAGLAGWLRRYLYRRASAAAAGDSPCCCANARHPGRPDRRGERRRPGRPAGRPGGPAAAPARPAPARRLGGQRRQGARHGDLRAAQRSGTGRQHRHGGRGAPAAQSPPRTWAW